MHHNEKTNDMTVPELADLSFSGTAEWAGQWVLLAHRATFDSEQKQSRLWLHIGGRMGHGGLFGMDVDERWDGRPRWEVAISTAEEARQVSSMAKGTAREAQSQQEIDTMVEKIKNAFRHAAGKDLARRSLSDRVGTRNNGKVFSEAIGQMLNRHELEEAIVVAGNNRSTQGYHRRFSDGS